MPPLRPLVHALRGAVAAGVAAIVPLAGLASLPLRAATPTPQQLQALEAALNSDADGALAGVLEEGPGFDPSVMESRRRLLKEAFPNARWWLRPGSSDEQGPSTVMLQVTGSRQDGPTTYRLESFQELTLSSNGQRINGQNVLREQSILRSGDEPLPVSLLIPDQVLTGQRYDVDVIFDDPLDGALAAGGILALTPQQIDTMQSPSMELGALGGGGLFKTVQAPFQPGSQTWAVLLVHPKGIVSATKRVRVVAGSASRQP